MTMYQSVAHRGRSSTPMRFLQRLAIVGALGALAACSTGNAAYDGDPQYTPNSASRSHTVSADTTDSVPVSVDTSYRSYLVRRDVKIWEGPSISSRQIGDLAAGAIVEAQLRPGPNIPWTWVTLRAGKTGYMVGNPMVAQSGS